MGLGGRCWAKSHEFAKSIDQKRNYSHISSLPKLYIVPDDLHKMTWIPGACRFSFSREPPLSGHWVDERGFRSQEWGPSSQGTIEGSQLLNSHRFVWWFDWHYGEWAWTGSRGAEKYFAAPTRESWVGLRWWCRRMSVIEMTVLSMDILCLHKTGIIIFTWSRQSSRQRWQKYNTAQILVF